MTFLSNYVSTHIYLSILVDTTKSTTSAVTHHDLLEITRHLAEIWVMTDNISSQAQQ